MIIKNGTLVLRNSVAKMDVRVEEKKIVEIAEKINTFETSILPFEDCCTIFVAKHPVTKPNINIIRKSEEKLAEKIDELMEEAIRSVEVVMVKP